MSVYMEKRAFTVDDALEIVKQAELKKQALNLRTLTRVKDLPRLFRMAKAIRSANEARATSKLMPEAARAARGSADMARAAIDQATELGAKKMKRMARGQLRRAQKAERAAWNKELKAHRGAIDELERELPKPSGFLERVGIKTSPQRRDAIRYIQQLKDEQELMEAAMRRSGTFGQRLRSGIWRGAGTAANTGFLGMDAYAIGSDLANGDLKGAARDAAAAAIFLPMFRGTGGAGRALKPAIKAMERVKYNPVAGWAVRNPMTATMWAPMAYNAGSHAKEHYNNLMDNVVTPAVMDRYVNRLEQEGLLDQAPAGAVSELGQYENGVQQTVNNAMSAQGRKGMSTGAGAGIGAIAGGLTGLGLEALSKKKKKRYLTAALASALAGGGVGALTGYLR